MHGWLKAVDAQTLNTDASCFYYSFNMATLLQTFARMIIDQFSRPPKGDPHLEGASKFSQTMEYFSSKKKATDDHNRKMSAAKYEV